MPTTSSTRRSPLERWVNAPKLLGWLTGTPAQQRRKELETCHAAAEMVLLVVILDKMVAPEEDFINSNAVEVIARRMYVLHRAFEKLHELADWKAPKGQGNRWKTKVQRHLADEYDVLALQDGELQVEKADEEVRKRLERKAFLAKNLDKTCTTGAIASAEEAS